MATFKSRFRASKTRGNESLRWIKKEGRWGGGGGGDADAAFKADVDDSLPGAGADRQSSDNGRAAETGGGGGDDIGVIVNYFAQVCE